MSRGDHPAIRLLGRTIVDGQAREIATLRAIHQRIFGASLSSMTGSHGSMGGEMEMEMDSSDLARATTFDRAFIDAMVPHHRAAIRMARTQLQDGADAELKRLSQAIIDTQGREIRQLRQWRERWYGARTTSG
jgi:uncharacterized protein (DUF305 family)